MRLKSWAPAYRQSAIERAKALAPNLLELKARGTLRSTDGS